MKQRVLIVSNGPVPAMPGFKIEGSGMRSWGLATGLAAQKNLKITVAVRNHYPIKDIRGYGDINIINWSPGSNLIKLANKFDVVIISYSTGKVAATLAKNLPNNIKFILDCYVPIYVEVSARNNSDIRQSFVNYNIDLKYFNLALKRGDYFLCAHDTQKHFYTGVLSALGIINPYSYKTDRILTVPFGIDKEINKNNEDPYINLGIEKNDFKLLWFGGLYPWFDITELLKAIKQLRSKNYEINLVIVGGKNPYNNNPEFINSYNNAVEFSRANSLFDKGVHFVDWVDFDKRLSWFNHASAVININSPGKENEYSWRTRIMDFIGGGATLLTNGGDPLSEQLIASKAAIRLNSANLTELVNLLTNIMSKDSDLLTEAAKNIKKIQGMYYWDKVVEPLRLVIDSDILPYKQEYDFRNSLKLNTLKANIADKKIGKALGSVRRSARKILKDNK